MTIADYQVLDDQGLAKKLRITHRRVRTLRLAKVDPIPSVRLGVTYRYLWGSPEMDAWLQRRSNSKPTSRRTR